jgi:hypothetical protein
MAIGQWRSGKRAIGQEGDRPIAIGQGIKPDFSRI